MPGKFESFSGVKRFSGRPSIARLAALSIGIVFTALLFVVVISCSNESKTTASAEQMTVAVPDTSYTIREYIEPVRQEVDGADEHGSDTWVQLGIVRMNADDSLEYYEVQKPLSWYNNYMAALEFCQTAEEGFLVLQDYEIVPADMTFAEYQSAMQMNVSNVLPRGGGKSGATGSAMQESVTIDVCEGDCCLALGKIEGPFFFGAYPPLFYIWFSLNGGLTKIACYQEGYCECDGQEINSGIILGFVGIWKPALEDYPIFAYLSDRYYGGLASYIRVTCGS